MRALRKPGSKGWPTGNPVDDREAVPEDAQSSNSTLVCQVKIFPAKQDREYRYEGVKITLYYGPCHYGVDNSSAYEIWDYCLHSVDADLGI